MNVPKVVRIGIALSMALAPWSTPVWAATATAGASVSATLASRTSLTLTRDSGSVTRGSATSVVFDRFDDVDVVGGSPLFMYAPYRSESGKNWHVANILTNGASMTLTASVTGTAGSTPLSDILFVFAGGFFEPEFPDPVGGTRSPDWEKLSTFTRTLSRPFVGTAPFNYRLTIKGISAGTYSGTITYTLTST